MNTIAKTLVLMCMVVVLVAAIGPEAEAQKKQVLVVKGDAAVAQLMDDLAHSFMNDHPDYSIVVSGGAAAGVVEALLSGEAQVGMSAHPISPDGEKLAEAKGAKLVSRVVDWEGLALICHPSNPVEKLTLDEVRNLFTGKIENWSQVKGKNAKVDLVVIETPRSGLGTYFNETALGNSPVSPSAARIEILQEHCRRCGQEPGRHRLCAHQVCGAGQGQRRCEGPCCREKRASYVCCSFRADDQGQVLSPHYAAFPVL